MSTFPPAFPSSVGNTFCCRLTENFKHYLCKFLDTSQLNRKVSWLAWAHQTKSRFKERQQLKKSPCISKMSFLWSHFQLAEQQLVVTAIDKTPSPNPGIHRVIKCCGTELRSHAAAEHWVTQQRQPSLIQPSSNTPFYPTIVSVHGMENLPPNSTLWQAFAFWVAKLQLLQPHRTSWYLHRMAQGNV